MENDFFLGPNFIFEILFREIYAFVKLRVLLGDQYFIKNWDLRSERRWFFNYLFINFLFSVHLFLQKKEDTKFSRSTPLRVGPGEWLADWKIFRVPRSLGTDAGL